MWQLDRIEQLKKDGFFTEVKLAQMVQSLVDLNFERRPDAWTLTGLIDLELGTTL